MHTMQQANVDEVVQDSRSAPCPVATEDGRKFVRFDNEPDEEIALWLPSPARDGDPLYCCGVQVGRFGGEEGVPGGSYVQTVETAKMPPKLAAHFRAMMN